MDSAPTRWIDAATLHWLLDGTPDLCHPRLMELLFFFLAIAAFVLFVLATLRPVEWVRLIAAGLACWVLIEVVARVRGL